MKRSMSCVAVLATALAGTPLARATADRVFAVGSNQYGQLGIGVDTWSPVPSLMTDAQKVAAGGYHSLALKTDGTVWAWGDNHRGSLGDGTTTSRSTPVQVPGLTGVAAIEAGYHSLALKTDGTVWAWGQARGHSCFILSDGTAEDQQDDKKMLVGLTFGKMGGYADTVSGRWGLNAYEKCTSQLEVSALLPYESHLDRIGLGS